MVVIFTVSMRDFLMEYPPSHPDFKTELRIGTVIKKEENVHSIFLDVQGHLTYKETVILLRHRLFPGNKNTLYEDFQRLRDSLAKAMESMGYFIKPGVIALPNNLNITNGEIEWFSLDGDGNIQCEPPKFTLEFLPGATHASVKITEG